MAAASTPRPAVILVPQADGEIGVFTPGRTRVVLTVADGRVETTDPAVAAAVLVSVPGSYREEDAPPDFDPAFHSLGEVNTYLDEHPEDVARVLDMERQQRRDVPAAKQQRTGVLDGPHGNTPDPAEQPAE